MKIENLINELDTETMSAVRGGLCVDVAGAVKEAYKQGGLVGALVTGLECLSLVAVKVPVCPA